MPHRSFRRLLSIACLPLLAAAAHAATSLDTVRVFADTPVASESKLSSGRFRFTRTGSIGDLDISFSIIGSTASPASAAGSYLGGAWPVGDKDYQDFASAIVGANLPATANVAGSSTYRIRIPAGSTSAVLDVRPFADVAIEGGEVVQVTLIQDAGYITSDNFAAQVTISDDDTTTLLAMPEFTPSEYLAGFSGGGSVSTVYEGVFRYTFSNVGLPRLVTTQMAGVAASSDYSLVAMHRHRGGSVASAEVTDGGWGYLSAPVVAISAGTQVRSIAITAGGSGYTSPPIVSFSAPAAGGRSAMAQAIVSGGAVVGIQLLDGGEGYAAAPTIAFVRTDGGSGADATASATLSQALAATTLSVVHIEPRSGLPANLAATVLIDGGGGSGASATLTWSGSTPVITVTSPGRGYTSAPSVSYSDTNGNLFVLGTAYMQVERVWLTAGGGGYSSATLTIAAPPGSITPPAGYSLRQATGSANVRRGSYPTPAPGDTILDRRTVGWAFAANNARQPRVQSTSGGNATYGDGKKGNTTIALSGGTDGFFTQGDVISIAGDGTLYTVTLVDGDYLHVLPALAKDISDSAAINNYVAMAAGPGSSNTLNLLPFWASSAAPNVANAAEVGYWGIEFAATPSDDTSAEGAEDVTLRVVSSTDYAVTDPTVATMQIADDDCTADIALGANASEPDLAGFATVTFSKSLPKAVSIPFVVTSSANGGAGYATLGVDCEDITEDGVRGYVTMPVGATAVDITVLPRPDAIAENVEYLTITLLESPDYLLAGGPDSQTNPSATINIVDRQGEVGVAVYPQVTVNGEPVRSDEDGVAGESMTAPDRARVMILYANQTSGGNQAFAITYGVGSGSTAVSGVDFNALSGSVTVAADQVKVILSQRAVGGQSSLIVQVAHPATGGSITFADGDLILLGSQVYRVAGPVTVTNAPTTLQLKQNAGFPNALLADVGSESGGVLTAEVQVGYEARAGAGKVYIEIVPRDDLIVEGDEVVVVTITSGQGYRIAEGAATATVAIVDDEPTLQIAATRIAGESALSGDPLRTGILRVSYEGATLPRAVPFSITIDASSTAVEATPQNEGDFQQLGRTYIMPANSRIFDIPVLIKDDELVEGTENLVVSLVDPGANASYRVSPVQGSATLTITDDEPTVGIEAVQATGTEGGTGPSFRIFNATARSGAAAPLQRDVQAAIAVQSSGTATRDGADADFLPLPGTLTISAGNRESPASVIGLVDDTIVESNETIVVAVVAANDGTGYAVSSTQSQVTLTISDNTEPLLTIAKTADGSEPSTDVQFTVTSSYAPAVPIQVLIEYTGTATFGSGNDYADPGAAVIAAGATSTVVTLDVQDDFAFEGDETVIATLKPTTPPRYRLGSTGLSATAAIRDNEPYVSVSAAANAGEGGAVGRLDVVRPGIANSSAITVRVRVSGGAAYAASAAAGGDYFLQYAVAPLGDLNDPANRAELAVAAIDSATPPAWREFDIAMGLGVSTAPIFVVPKQDSTVEQSSAETIVAVIRDDPLAVPTYQPRGGATTASIYITDDEPLVGFASAAPIALSEAASGAPIVVGVALANGVGPMDVRIGVQASATGASATMGSDVTGIGLALSAAGATLAIPAGATTASFQIQALDDAVVEQSEGFQLVVLADTASPPAYSIDPAAPSRQVTIADDDGAGGTVSLSAIRDAREPDIAGMVRATYAPPSGGLRGELAVALQPAGGTAAAGADYQRLPSSIVFSPGQLSVDIPVVPMADSASEADETVIVSVLAVSGMYATSPAAGAAASVRIVDADPAGGKPPVAEPGSGSGGGCGLGGGSVGLIGLALFALLRRGRLR